MEVCHHECIYVYACSVIKKSNTKNRFIGFFIHFRFHRDLDGEQPAFCIRKESAGKGAKWNEY